MPPKRTPTQLTVRGLARRSLRVAARELEARGLGPPRPPPGQRGVLVARPFREEWDRIPVDLHRQIWEAVWEQTVADYNEKTIEVIGDQQFWTLVRTPPPLPTAEGRRARHVGRPLPRRVFPATNYTRPNMPATIRANLTSNKIYLPEDLILRATLRRMPRRFAFATTDHQFIERMMWDEETFREEHRTIRTHAGMPGQGLNDINSRYFRLREVYILRDNHCEDHDRLYLSTKPDRAAYATYRTQNHLTMMQFAHRLVRQRAPIELSVIDDSQNPDPIRVTWDEMVDDVKSAQDPGWNEPTLFIAEWNRLSRKEIANLPQNVQDWIGLPREQCHWDGQGTPCTCDADAPVQPMVPGV